MSTRMIKGAQVIQARALVDGRLGGGTYDTLAEAQDAARGSLLPGAWYPADPYVDALRNAARELGMDLETLSREVARRSAFVDLPSLYRVFIRVADPSHLLHLVPQMWRTYFSFAETRVVQNDVGRFIAQCDDVPPELLQWVCGCWLGFLPASVELIGQRPTSAKILRTWRQSDTANALQFEMHYHKPA